MIVSIAGIAQKFRAIRVSDDGLQMKLAVANFRKRANRYLASPAEAVEQRAFASGGGGGCGVIEKFEMLPGSGVAFTDLDGEGSLARGGAHELDGNNLLHEFGLAQALQSGRSENDGVVFSLLEFAEADGRGTPQRINFEIGADG